MDTPDFAALDRKIGYLGKQGLSAAKATVLAGAKVFARQAKVAGAAYIQAHVPATGHVRRVLTGNLVRSINARSIKQSGAVVGAKSGLDVGSKDIAKGKLSADGNRGSHGHLYVSGTVKRETGSVGIRVKGKRVGRRPTGNPVQNRGIMPAAMPSFIKTSAESAVGAVEAAMYEKLTAGLNKAIGNV